MTNSLVLSILSLQGQLHRLEQHTRLRMVTVDWDTATTEDRMYLNAQLDHARVLRNDLDRMIRLFNQHKENQ